MKYVLYNASIFFLLITTSVGLSPSKSLSSQSLPSRNLPSQLQLKKKHSFEYEKKNKSLRLTGRTSGKLIKIPDFFIDDEFKKIENTYKTSVLSTVRGFDDEKSTISSIGIHTADSNLETPFTIMWREIADDFSKIVQSITPHRPISSGQKQLPLIERIAKGIHEESAPWVISLFFPFIASAAISDVAPLHCSVFLELCFLLFCSTKLFLKFDVPATKPEPLLKDRNWDYVYNSVWESQKNIQSKRKFLTAWFYDAPYERIRREDALRFLAWLKFSVDESDLKPSQLLNIEMKDLPRLEHEVNNGIRFDPRDDKEMPLECLRFNLEPIRFRHKPLLFYIFTHGAKFCIKNELKKLGFAYTPPKDPKKNLGYFYRPGASSMSDKTPLVFVHGVGGITYYFELIKEIGKKVHSPIILVDLPFVSLQVSDDIPSIIDQVQSVCNILDKNVGETAKATFVGHSFGSLMLSWMVQSVPDRVANCVFLDPVCFQLHLRNSLFNFHFQRVDQSIQSGKRWQNPFSVSSFVNLAGTEMHTNNAMLRHFWWATNALWPADLERNNIPASIMVSEKDEIIPSAEIEELFLNYEREKIKRKDEFLFFSKMEKKVLLRANTIHGANHGEFVFNNDIRNKVVRTILAMARLNDIIRKKL